MEPPSRIRPNLYEYPRAKRVDRWNKISLIREPTRRKEKREKGMGKATHTTHRIRTQMLPITSPSLRRKKLLISRRQSPSSVQWIPPGRFYIKAKSEQSNKAKHQKEQKRGCGPLTAGHTPNRLCIRPALFVSPGSSRRQYLPQEEIDFVFPGFLGLCFLFVQLTLLLCTCTVSSDPSWAFVPRAGKPF